MQNNTDTKIIELTFVDNENNLDCISTINQIKNSEQHYTQNPHQFNIQTIPTQSKHSLQKTFQISSPEKINSSSNHATKACGIDHPISFQDKKENHPASMKTTPKCTKPSPTVARKSTEEATSVGNGLPLLKQQTSPSMMKVGEKFSIEKIDIPILKDFRSKKFCRKEVNNELKTSTISSSFPSSFSSNISNVMTWDAKDHLSSAAEPDKEKKLNDIAGKNDVLVPIKERVRPKRKAKLSIPGISMEELKQQRLLYMEIQEEQNLSRSNKRQKMFRKYIDEEVVTKEELFSLYDDKDYKESHIKEEKEYVPIETKRVPVKQEKMLTKTKTCSRKKPSHSQNFKPYQAHLQSHDIAIHNTTWRALRFFGAPVSLLTLPMDQLLYPPYCRELNASLCSYDSKQILQQSQLDFDFSTSTTLRTNKLNLNSTTEVEEKVKSLIKAYQPHLKQLHQIQIKNILQQSRLQTNLYLKNLELHRQISRNRKDLYVSIEAEIDSFEKEKFSRLKDMAKKKEIEKNGKVSVEYVITKVDRKNNRIESPMCKHMVHLFSLPRSVTLTTLSKCLVVEEQKELVFLPYIKDGVDLDVSNFETDRDSKQIIHHEMDEYLLKYIIHICGTHLTIFEAFSKCTGFDNCQETYQQLIDCHSRNENVDKQKKYLENLFSKYSMTKNINPTIRSILQHLLHDTYQQHIREIFNQPLTRIIPFDFSNWMKDPNSYGIRVGGKYSEIIEAYRQLLCRRCYVYDCINHGIETPLPSVRWDPIEIPEIKPPNSRYDSLENMNNFISLISDDDEQSSSNSNSNYQKLEDKSSSLVVIKKEENEKEIVKVDSPLLPTRRSGRTTTSISSKATESFITQQMQIQKQQQQQTSMESSKNHSSFMSPPPILPCGSSCYRHNFLLSNPLLNLGKENFTVINEIDGKKNEWKEIELQVIKKCVEVVQEKNPCKIAKLLGNKSCHQVYSMIQTEIQQPDEMTNNNNNNINNNNSFKKKKKSSKRKRCFHTSQHRRKHGEKIEEYKAQFTPCNHNGLCLGDNKDCSCTTSSNHACERSCPCPRECPNRVGCNCKSGCRTKTCPCVAAGRECDPDRCHNCGSWKLRSMLISLSDNETKQLGIGVCENLNLQQRQFKKIKISPSGIHGWGAYAMECIKKNEIFYEYVGAKITHEEAERRGKTYDQAGFSYLFDINDDVVADALRKGNKSKFFNHSFTPNCSSTMRLVNGDHRIAFQANRFIEEGEELMFDYGYSKEIAPDWNLRLQLCKQDD